MQLLRYIKFRHLYYIKVLLYLNFITGKTMRVATMRRWSLCTK